MLSNAELEQYLKRIACKVEMDLSLASLTELHRLHLLYVPFENLDIPLGNKINLGHESVFNKIILQKRGGFCYELNYAFAVLLKTLGFKVELLSARVFNEGSYGDAFAHMLLLVEAKAKQVIVDVGFGGSFIEPFVFEEAFNIPVKKDGYAYSLKAADNNEFVLLKKDKEEWAPQYIFTQKKYEILDFQAMCDYQQSSPNSVFTQKSVCSIATIGGRKTISNGRFIETTGSHKIKNIIANETEYRAILKKYFQIELPLNAPIDKLLVESYSTAN